MADERKCYAGDLGSDALGKTVMVPATHGERARSGVVREVVHFLGVSPRRARTQVVLEPARGELSGAPMVELDSNVVVEVAAS